MGTDDLHHKRKAKMARDLARKRASRAPYERVLIVCEGRKTEPYYFLGLRTALRLNRANVVIADKKKGLDPTALVRYAIDEASKDPEFDHVYCVFDKDKHPGYNSAIDRIHSISGLRGYSMHAIASIPCFEIWLLLHFLYTTRAYIAPLQDSNADLVIRDLKAHLPDYEKGSKDTFAVLADRTETAIGNAKSLEKFHETSGTDNPSTKVHILVEYLQKLGNKNDGS